MSRVQIDDAEPAHPDSGGAIGIDTFVVRTTMADLVEHRLKELRFRGALAIDKSGNSTHSGETPSRVTSVGFSWYPGKRTMPHRGLPRLGQCGKGPHLRWEPCACVSSRR